MRVDESAPETGIRTTRSYDQVFTPRRRLRPVPAGIFSKQLAPHVQILHCVEPNRERREQSVGYLSGCPNVRIIDGSAEATGLPDGSVDVVTAAQAFHWFDRDRAKREFRRILAPGGRAALLWYERLTTGDPFLEGYERLLLQYSIDYTQVDHRNITPEIIAGFFHPSPVRRIKAMMADLFNRCRSGGTVEFRYRTTAYFGRLTEPGSK